jgi:outer membrane receptor protein involved in Fe transport
MTITTSSKKLFSSFQRTALFSACLMPLAMPLQAYELEEVVVTATKRAESIQDVPVSVAAIDSETMKAMGITDMAQISAQIPNFEVSDASILPNLYVRGIGSGTTHSIEQSVGRFIDDVYIGRAAINLHGFMDIASVEVLRGPQGTLFGKNTLGGAMIVHTAEPTDELSVGLDLSASNFSTTGGSKHIEGFISGALTDNLRARFAYQWKEKDGYIENLLPGPDGGTRDDSGARLKFEWDAGRNTTVGLKLEYMEYEEEGQTPAQIVGGNFPGGPFAGQSIPESFWQQFAPQLTYKKDWTSHINCAYEQNGETFCPSRDQYSQNVTLNVDHEIEGLGTITSVSAFQQYEYNHQFVAVDMGVVGGSLRATRDEEFEGFSQEIRLTSEEFEKYDYIVGLYFEDSSLERLQPSDFNIPEFVGGGPLFSEREDWIQDTKTLALFGQLRYHINDQWSAIAGGRWSQEDKDFVFEIAHVEFQEDPLTEVDHRYDESRSEKKFTPSFTLRYEPNEELMFFASYAQGHKTGGYSDRIQDDIEFDAETNTTLEFGMKGIWLDGNLETNLAIFHMAIEDLQVARTLPGETTQFEVKNAAEATSQGVEFDARWALNENWILGGNFAYTDATYDDFPGAAESCPEVGGNLEAGLCNYEGVPLIYAPEYKAAVYVQYDAEDIVGEWDLSSRVDANYSDDYYVEINYDERLHQDSYTTWGASVRLTSPDEKFAIGLVGKNLTEEYVMAWGLTGGFTQYIAPNSPREIMLQFSYNY